MRSRLLMTEALRSLPLDVETRGALVLVSGSVHDTTQARIVRSIAEAVEGVQQVELDLRVVAPADSAEAPAQPARRRSRPEQPDEALPSLEEAG